MNITVRTDGIINNTLTEEQFVNITSQLFGEGKTLDEYISEYNDAPQTKKAGIVVHKEVPEDHAEVEKQIEEKFPTEATAQDYLDAATDTFSDIAGKPVTVEFKDDE